MFFVLFLSFTEFTSVWRKQLTNFGMTSGRLHYEKMLFFGVIYSYKDSYSRDNFHLQMCEN